MTVYVAFRRGNYFYAAALAILWKRVVPAGGLLRRLLRAVVRDTWMESALYFTSPCTGRACTLCAVNGVRPATGYHYLTVSATPQNGVRALVDQRFDKPDAWLFMRMDGVGENDCLRFFREVGHGRTYNARGARVNFLPCCGNVGLRDNNWQAAPSFFCSEMLTAFLQSHGYDMGLQPCKVTPQRLAVSLVERFQVEQYAVDSGGVLYKIK